MRCFDLEKRRNNSVGTLSSYLGEPLANSDKGTMNASVNDAGPLVQGGPCSRKKLTCGMSGVHSCDVHMYTFGRINLEDLNAKDQFWAKTESRQSSREL